MRELVSEDLYNYTISGLAVVENATIVYVNILVGTITTRNGFSRIIMRASHYSYG